MFTSSWVQDKFSGGDVNALWHCAWARAPESPHAPNVLCTAGPINFGHRLGAWGSNSSTSPSLNFIVRPLHTKLYFNPRYIVSLHCILFLLSLPTSTKLRFLCLFVRLFVSNFEQKLPNGFGWNFQGRLAMGQWKKWLNSGGDPDQESIYGSRYGSVSQHW